MNMLPTSPSRGLNWLNETPIPHDMLAELRRLRRTLPGALDGDLVQFGLTRLHRSRNNRAFHWASPAGPLCLKVYRTDKRDRARCEWTALRHVTAHGLGITAQPVWYDPDPELPAVAMTLVGGVPVVTTLANPATILPTLIETLHEIRRLPLGAFASMGRLGSALDALRRIISWSEQLPNHLDEPGTHELIRLRNRWADLGDAAVLVEPAPLVLSTGDANLDNWFWDADTGTLRVLDWEFAGHSTVAYDTAELIEHPSARRVADHHWLDRLPDLGVVDAPTHRSFAAARRTIALYWLAKRWKHRHTNYSAYDHQLCRTIEVIGGQR